MLRPIFHTLPFYLLKNIFMVYKEKRTSGVLTDDQLAQKLVDRMNRESVPIKDMEFRDGDKEKMIQLIRGRYRFLQGDQEEGRPLTLISEKFDFVTFKKEFKSLFIQVNQLMLKVGRPECFKSSRYQVLLDRIFELIKLAFNSCTTKAHVFKLEDEIAEVNDELKLQPFERYNASVCVKEALDRITSSH
jgi:hypothetical protein